MNVSCNIFINSFGSIAETTMVSESKYRLLFPAGNVSLPEICTLCIGFPAGGGESGVFSDLQCIPCDLGIFTVLFNVLGEDIHLQMAKEPAGLAYAKYPG